MVPDNQTLESQSIQQTGLLGITPEMPQRKKKISDYLKDLKHLINVNQFGVSFGFLLPSMK